MAEYDRKFWDWFHKKAAEHRVWLKTAKREDKQHLNDWLAEQFYNSEKATRPANKSFDCTKLTFQQMANVVRAILLELKRRNPIGVNLYTGGLTHGISALEEIHNGEKGNPTCEAGPGIDKPRKKGKKKNGRG